MAGAIDNAVILAAMNQTVKAINDLAQSIAALSFSADVTCSPQVTVTCTCSGSAGTGSALPSDDGQEGQTPPPGYVEPDPATTDRKCKVSNMVHDSMVSLVDKLAVLDADQYAAIGFTLTLSAVGAAVGSLLPGPGTLIGAVAGVVLAIATQLVTGGAALDLTDLGTVLSTNQEALVNALYNATSAELARDAYLAIVDAGGASLVERTIIQYALTTDLLNLLFFTKEEYEPDIAAYVGAIDCTYVQVLAWHFDTGPEGWVFTDSTPATSYALGTWSSATPYGGDSSPGHLRITEYYGNNGSFDSAWRFTFPLEARPIAGEDTVLSMWYKTSQEGGYGRVDFTIIFADDSFVTSEVYLSDWTYAESPLINHADDWGKSIKALQVRALRTGQNTSGHIIDVDAVTLAGVS